MSTRSATASRLARGSEWFLSPSRIAGVDLARGLAVIGMLAAHLLTIDAFDAGRPETWIDIANGRSSILFATLAGVSIALVTGGVVPVGAQQMAVRRRRLAMRAALVWFIGVLLVLTGVPVYVILPAYAVLFLLALPLLRLRARSLWALAVVLGLVMPWLQPAWDALPVWDGVVGSDLSLMLGWHYPFTTWIAFVVAGLAAGRSDLRRLRTAVMLLGGGALVSAVGYSVTAVDLGSAGGYVAQVWTADAHSSGLLEVVGSGGFALAAIGGSLLVCRTPASWFVLPIRAVGAMPLTAYVGQLVAWAVAAWSLLGGTADLMGFRDLETFWPFVVTTVVACTAWAMLVGQGPMERLIAWVAALGTGPGGTARRR